MKKITSAIIILSVGLNILSCNEGDSSTNASNPESMSTMKADVTNITPDDVNNFIVKSHHSALKYLVDDDREL
ncbi:hypothetical protein [Flagellimonas sp. W118]|uniref:hypothetical protein n=1 Tax=Flagellimonas sp. W118 TaxID=3410791 RepID=UPI003BF4D137